MLQPIGLIPMLLGALVLMSTGCSRYKLPAAPERLTPILFAEETHGASVSTPNFGALVGTLQVVGEVAQYSLSGPPVRLRSEVDFSTEDGAIARLLGLDVSPADLRESLGLKLGQDVKLSDSWPLKNLGHLSSTDAMERWLAVPPAHDACTHPPAHDVSVSFSVRPIGTDSLVTFEGHATVDSTYRGDLTGYLLRSPEGEVRKAHVKIRRWTHYTSTDCDLVQVETTTLLAGDH